VKKLIIGLLTLVFAVSCIAQDRSATPTRAAQFSWTELRNPGDGMFTTTVNLDADLKHYRGAVTLWIDPDTTGSSSDAVKSDSCMTVSIQLYNAESAEWGTYFSTVSKLDTIDRAVVNVAAAGTDIYIPLAKYNSDQFAWADRIRVTLGIGVADEMGGSVWIGGQ